MADNSVTKRRSSGTRRKDLTGHVFERLIVLEFDHSDGNSAFWKCKCTCGKVIVTAGTTLRRGQSRSCGCLQKDVASIVHTKHGHCSTGVAYKDRPPEYNVWQNMLRRCEGIGEKAIYYTERGITVCDRWKHSFANFYADMGPRPSDKHTIERKDNDGHYCPENCCWDTRHNQARNTRQNRWITFQNETLCLSDWAERLGITSVALYLRLTKFGWSVEKSLTTPKKFSRQQ